LAGFDGTRRGASLINHNPAVDYTSAYRCGGGTRPPDDADVEQQLAASDPGGTHEARLGALIHYRNAKPPSALRDGQNVVGDGPNVLLLCVVDRDLGWPRWSVVKSSGIQIGAENDRELIPLAAQTLHLPQRRDRQGAGSRDT
jgi:hypothetical protein